MTVYNLKSVAGREKKCLIRYFNAELLAAGGALSTPQPLALTLHPSLSAFAIEAVSFDASQQDDRFIAGPS